MKTDDESARETLATSLLIQAERQRIADYIRAMAEPDSGYYWSAPGTNRERAVTAIVRRLATDITLGEHAKPFRTNNPELWK